MFMVEEDFVQDFQVDRVSNGMSKNLLSKTKKKNSSKWNHGLEWASCTSVDFVKVGWLVSVAS